MSLLNLALLGDFQMRNPSGALINLSARKSQALLAFLSVKPGHSVSRDKMSSLLWSSTGPEQARQSLRQTLSNLRKELTNIAPAEKLLIEEGDLLSLDPAFVSSDVARFESLTATGTDEALLEATRLYRGDFLEGFLLNEDRFDQWTLAERDRLHRMSLRAHQALMESQTRRGDVDQAVATAQQAIGIDPLQENMHRALMRLYLQGGDLVKALYQYDVLAKLLKRELGIEPDAETKALQQQIAQTRSRRSQTPAAEKDSRKSILVVEDNALNRELANAVLKTAGYRVLLAEDGADALMLMATETVDLLLLDIDLPYIDGHSVLQALKDKGIDVPTIFVSGLPGEEPELRAFEVGAADFIHKPMKNSVLLARVAKVLKPDS